MEPLETAWKNKRNVGSYLLMLHLLNGEALIIYQLIEEKLATGAYSWLLMVHGETSTGMLNNLEEIKLLCKRYNVLLCVDCVSSFGALPFTLEGVYLATGVSGKAIGTMSGLAFVFANTEITSSNNIPSYLDLGLSVNNAIPFTIPSQFVHSLEICFKSL